MSMTVDELRTALREIEAPSQTEVLINGASIDSVDTSGALIVTDPAADGGTVNIVPVA